MRRQSGFSLPEMLIFIGIIWLLAALLFPVFNTARKRSYETECASHLRQIGIAIQMYLTDHDDEYPLRLLALMPGYVSHQGVFLCRLDHFEGNAPPGQYWVSPGTSYFYLGDVDYGIDYFRNIGAYDPNFPDWAVYIRTMPASEAKVVSDSWHRFPEMTLRLYADGHVKMEPSAR